MIIARAFKQPFMHGREGVQIFIEDQGSGRSLGIAEPVVFKASEPYTASLPTVELPQESAQKLIDDLWDCGLRPSEGAGSAGAMMAVENHLADLRTLLFKQMKIKGAKI